MNAFAGADITRAGCTTPNHTQENDMRLPIPLLAAVLLATAAPAAAAADASSSPLVGRWSLDRSSMAGPPETRPRQVTIAFSADGPQRLAMAVDVVDGDGGRRRMGGTVALDGTPVEVAGGGDADRGAMRMPAEGVLVLGLAKDRIPVSTRVYSVSRDRREMTEVASYIGPDGNPLLRTSRFTRVD